MDKPQLQAEIDQYLGDLRSLIGDIERAESDGNSSARSMTSVLGKQLELCRKEFEARIKIAEGLPLTGGDRGDDAIRRSLKEANDLYVDLGARLHNIESDEPWDPMSSKQEN